MLRTIYTPIALLVARGPWSPCLGFESRSTRGANSTSEEFAPLRGGLAGGILRLLINGTSHKPLHFRVRALYSKPTLTWRRIPLAVGSDELIIQRFPSGTIGMGSPDPGLKAWVFRCNSKGRVRPLRSSAPPTGNP